MTLSLPSFVVAPEARGRGYDVYSAHRFQARWTVDLPMVMLAWSQKLIKEDFAACVDLGQDGLLVCRGNFVRQLKSGDAIALLNGVALSNEQLASLGHRSDWVAASLPIPEEGSNFGAVSHNFERPNAPYVGPLWPELTLGWNDRYLKVQGDCDGLKLVTTAIESIDPAPQRSRVRSWSTTDTLPARGSIDLISQAQLVIGSNEADAPARFLRSVVDSQPSADGRPRCSLRSVEPGKAPASFSAYGHMVKLLASQGEAVLKAGELSWSTTYADASPSALSQRIALHLAGKLKLSVTLRTLELMVGHEDAAIRQGGEEAAMRVLERLMERERLDSSAVNLIEALENKEPVFSLVLRGRGLENQDTKLVAELARIAAQTAQSSQQGRKLDAPSIASFAAAFAQLASDEKKFIDRALTLVQSWPDDSSGDIADMLTSTTARAFAAKDTPALRAVARKLVGPEFLNRSTFKSPEHALQRIAAACVTLDELGS